MVVTTPVGMTDIARMCSYPDLDPYWVLELARNMLRTLCSLHRLGVLHRDVSLKNMILIQPENDWRRKGNCKFVLIDFGSSTTFPKDSGNYPIYFLALAHPHARY